jgi:tetratricopeptide (TPR) repeat protein
MPPRPRSRRDLHGFDRRPALRLDFRSAVLSAALIAFVGCASSVEDRLAEVRALQDAGQFSESVQPLRDLLAKNPDQPEANYLLGVALVQTGQPSLAVWPLEKASNDPSQALPAGVLLASTFLGLQSHDDAVRIATQVLEKDPGRIAALKIRAQALLGANDREKAIEDTARLRELAPDDYQSVLLHATILAELGRIPEAEKAHEDLEAVAAKTGDPGTIARGCLARAAFFKDNLKDDARAEAHYKKCLEQSPSEPLALRLVTQFYDERQRGDEATAIWEKALKDAPENLQIRSSVAGRYEALGKADQALALHKEGVELLGSTQAWYQLADFERRRQNSERALEAVEQAIAASPSPNENLSFFKADLLVDLNRLDEAEALVSGFKEVSFRDLLQGRILLARGDAKGALATFDSGLKRWPNNAGGRYLAGLAAHRIGDFARAESEFRESIRVDGGATDASYALATIYLAQGRYKEAAEQARSFVAKRGGARPEGYVAFVRASIAMQAYDSARHTIDALREAGFAKEAAQASIQVDLAEKGWSTAWSNADARGLDLGAAENEGVLRALVDGAIAAGDASKAHERVSELVAKNADSAPLHEIAGAVLIRLGRDADAKAELDRAQQLDPANARVKTGHATLLARAGDSAGAIALFDEAAKAANGDLAAAYAAAQLVLASGDAAGARARLEEIVKRDAGHAGARNDLAWLLAQSNQDLARAQALAEEAYRIDPSPEIGDTLGYVLMQQSQLDRAVELLQQAVAKRPDSPSIRYHLGLALGRQGEKQRALDTLRQALEAGPFPEAEAAKSELARLEAQ